MVTLSSRLRGQIASVRNDLNYPLYGSSQPVQPTDEVLLNRGYGKVPGTKAGHAIYDWVTSDPHIYAVLQKRYSAVYCREWEVKPASDRRQDKKAADMVRAQLENLSTLLPEEDNEATVTTTSGFDQLTHGLLDAVVKGFSPAEIQWDTDGAEIVAREVQVIPQRRFTFIPGQKGFKLRLLTPENMLSGIALPSKKFIVHRYGITDDPFGAGIGSKLFWCKWFKSQDIRFWLAFVDRFASPLPIGKYPNGRDDLKATLLDAMRSIAHEAGIAIPEGSTLEFLNAEKSGSITCYKDLADYMDREVSKAVLGETGSTDQQGSGGSRARDQVGNGVRLEIAKGDADLLSETLNRTLVKWITELNLPDATPPKVWRRFKDLEEETNYTEHASLLKTLQDMGYKAKREYVATKFEIDLENARNEGEGSVSLEGTALELAQQLLK